MVLLQQGGGMDYKKVAEDLLRMPIVASVIGSLTGASEEDVESARGRFGIKRDKAIAEPINVVIGRAEGDDVIVVLARVMARMSGQNTMAGYIRGLILRDIVECGYRVDDRGLMPRPHRTAIADEIRNISAELIKAQPHVKKEDDFQW